MASWLFYNSAQALAVMCVIGLALSIWRLRDTPNAWHLVAFTFMLGGTLLRELVALHYGVAAWPPSAMWLSGLARVLKLVGALMFVRAVTEPRCGEWAWIAVALTTVTVAVVVPA